MNDWRTLDSIAATYDEVRPPIDGIIKRLDMLFNRPVAAPNSAPNVNGFAGAAPPQTAGSGTVTHGGQRTAC